MPRPRRPGHAAAFALALGALVVVGSAGCNPKVVGNGVWAEKHYDAPPFDRIQVSLGFHAAVQVVSGPGAFRSVAYSGDENVLEQLTFEVVDGVLTMTSAFTIDSVHPLQVRVTTLELAGLEAREESSITASGVVASPFTVRAVEGSRVTVSGSPGDGATLTATLAAGSVLDAHAFPVASAELTLSSHSEATLLSAGPVTGAATEASAVTVTGGGTCGLALTGSTCTVVPPAP